MQPCDLFDQNFFHNCLKHRSGVTANTMQPSERFFTTVFFQKRLKQRNRAQAEHCNRSQPFGPSMWTLWVISGYLRLSPRYLPAIFTIDANLVPAISGYLPLSSPTDGFFPGYLRLSPAIFTYLWILYRLSPAISRLSSRYLQVFVSFFARVFICDGFHFSA